ncbi:iron ABC transporter permease, partial [Enterobacter hormaechei]|nr:iron ABC transporter permease [Enterobacter hormaechei]
MSVTTEPMPMVKQQLNECDIKAHYRHILRRRIAWILFIVLAIGTSIVLDFTMGPSGLSLQTLWQTLVSPESVNAATQVIVWDIRLPYAL